MHKGAPHELAGGGHVTHPVRRSSTRVASGVTLPLGRRVRAGRAMR